MTVLLEGLQTKHTPVTQAVAMNQPKLNFPIIRDVPVRMDSHGRMNLNDLHKASGEGDHKAPNKWTRLQSTQDLIDAYVTTDMASPLEIVMIGDNDTRGTWSIEELATDYAQWLSTPFKVECLRVLREFNHGNIQQTQPQLSELQMIAQIATSMHETNEAVAQNTAAINSIGSTVEAQTERMNVLEERINQPVDMPQADSVPSNMLTVGEMYHQLRKYMLSEATIKAVIAANEVKGVTYKVIRNGRLVDAKHYDKAVMGELMSQLINTAEHREGTLYRHTHEWVCSFDMKPQTPAPF